MKLLNHLFACLELYCFQCGNEWLSNQGKCCPQCGSDNIHKIYID